MTRRLLAVPLCALLLAGCGQLKQKAADYYLGKARKTAEAQNPPRAEVEAAFADVGKALEYAPGSAAAVELLGRLADLAGRTGFPGAQELESAALRKALAGAPLNWAAREALTGFYAARGDTGGMEAMAAQARDLYVSQDAAVKYCALLSELAASASSLPWIESQAYMSLNKSAATLFERASAYEAVSGRVRAVKTELDKMAAAAPGVKKAAPPELVSSAEVAAADALRDPRPLAAITAFNAKAASDPAFKKAVEMTVQGNAALVQKEYSKARAFYQGGLNHYPALLDARRQMAEADFQEGAALAAAGKDLAASAQLLNRAYGGAGEVIRQALETGNLIPFIPAERFLGETYALKAADIAALRAVEGGRLRRAAALEKEFREALDEALKLNPEGRLARELLERYTKEGF